MTGRTVGDLSDVCLLVADIPRSVEFYRDRLGFAVKRLDTGFAEFWTGGVILALWQRDDLAGNLDLPAAKAGGTSAMMAVRLASAEAVDAEYRRLSDRGVAFHAPPKAYTWNAHGTYFTAPDGHLWEIYAWLGDPRTVDTLSETAPPEADPS